MVAEGSVQNVSGTQSVNRIHLRYGEAALCTFCPVNNRFGTMADGRTFHPDILQKAQKIFIRTAARCPEVSRADSIVDERQQVFKSFFPGAAIQNSERAPLRFLNDSDGLLQIKTVEQNYRAIL